MCGDPASTMNFRNGELISKKSQVNFITGTALLMRRMEASPNLNSIDVFTIRLIFAELEGMKINIATTDNYPI